MLRHSIAEDVPDGRRGLVWRGYWAWLFMASGFCVDWITITMMCACHLCTSRVNMHAHMMQPSLIKAEMLCISCLHVIIHGMHLLAAV